MAGKRIGVLISVWDKRRAGNVAGHFTWKNLFKTFPSLFRNLETQSLYAKKMKALPMTLLHSN